MMNSKKRRTLALVVSSSVLVGGGFLLATNTYATPKPTPSPTPTPSATHAMPGVFSIALTGDMPYDALGVLQTPNVIADINKSNVAFTLFDGDTMSGKETSAPMRHTRT